jgi:hypothetical protein
MTHFHGGHPMLEQWDVRNAWLGIARAVVFSLIVWAGIAGLVWLIVR